MIDRSLTLKLLSASTLALAFAQPALAQDTVDSSDSEATGAEQADNGALDVIVVTANRREENLQDVAVSAATISADSAKTIFDAGADVTALAARVPGLFVESSNGRAAPRFYIRGLGNTDFDLAASQPVSVVHDDVVMENVTLKSFPIFDVARIEVLRGPQGTLFGRNTPAGIVKIDTVKPGDEFAVTGSASVGSFMSVSVDGGLTVPIVPGVASLRLSGLWQQRDDWVDNGFTGEENAYGAYSDIAGRAQLLGQRPGLPLPAAAAGVHGLQGVLADLPRLRVPGLQVRHAHRDRGRRMSPQLLEGSDAIAHAMVAAGCRFFSGYPMTPFT
ncbi:MAG: TonB-dependent receptor plug domain-containing protein, partial [Qipengyuania vulgaris]